MAFANGPETDEQTLLAFLEMALVRIDDDRWVEERSRFYRIFMRKIRTYQVFLVIAELVIIVARFDDVRLDLLAMFRQLFGDVAVALRKVLQQRQDHGTNGLGIELEYFF